MTPPEDVQATFAATLVDEWVRGGVAHAVVCPGSRSTPLALAVAERGVGDGGLTVHVHHDERSAGFLAVGIGLATGRPAIVVTTSGTGAAELHPAVVEAHQAGVPLLACTTDRPAELRDVGAPQTIDQVHLYGRAVRWFADPGVPDPAGAGRWRALAARALAEATGDHPGPVQLNLPFREPLVGAPGPLPPARPGGRPWSVLAPSSAGVGVGLGDLGVLGELAGRRGVIVAGPRSGDGDALHRVAAALGWPVLADPRSPAWRPAPTLVAHLDALLRSPRAAEALRPEVIVRLGPPPASRVVTEWLAASGADEVVVAGRSWSDPAGTAATVVRAEPAEAVAAWAASLASAAPDPGGASGVGSPSAVESGSVGDPGGASGVGSPSAVESGSVGDPGGASGVASPSAVESGSVGDPGGALGGVPSSAVESGAVRRPGRTSRAVPPSAAEPGSVQDLGGAPGVGPPSEPGSVGDPGVVPPSAAGPGTAPGPAPQATPAQPPAGWLGAWQAAAEAAATTLASLLDPPGGQTDAGGPSEPAVARQVVAALPDGAELVVSSSMPVRDVERYASPRSGLRIVANRGANGIDGVVSTAVGVAAGSGAPTALLIGDLAFLHDSNGLLGASGRGIDLVCVVVDNDGGGIFSFLPQATSVPAERFEQLFGTPHGLDLVAVAAALGVEARAVTGDLVGEVRAALDKGGVHVLVVRTDRAANVEVHRRLDRAVAEAVDAALEP